MAIVTHWPGLISTQGLPGHSETPTPSIRTPGKTRARRAQLAALRAETRTRHPQSTSFTVVKALKLQLPLLALAWGAQLCAFPPEPADGEVGEPSGDGGESRPVWEEEALRFPGGGAAAATAAAAGNPSGPGCPLQQR